MQNVHLHKVRAKDTENEDHERKTTKERPSKRYIYIYINEFVLCLRRKQHTYAKVERPRGVETLSLVVYLTLSSPSAFFFALANYNYLPCSGMHSQMARSNN